MRKLAYLVGLFLLIGWPAAAQESRPTTDLSLGYSYIRANPSTTDFSDFNANGGTASLAYNPRSWYGIAGEFGDYHVGQIGGTGVDTNLIAYMFGPEVYYHHFGHITPFMQGLFGGAHSNGAGFGTPGTRNSFAMAAGGGVDIPFRKHASIRLGPVDYLLTDFPEFPGGGRKVQNNLRSREGSAGGSNRTSTIQQPRSRTSRPASSFLIRMNEAPTGDGLLNLKLSHTRMGVAS